MVQFVSTIELRLRGVVATSFLFEWDCVSALDVGIFSCFNCQVLRGHDVGLNLLSLGRAAVS